MSGGEQNRTWFGINIDPNASGIELALDLARYADEANIDIIGVQDHPYNGAFLETWTLLSVLGARTERVRLFPNVASLPLRPPAMLAKAAASLDLLTGGRVELGLGAGALWDAIEGYGGTRREPGEAVEALEEAIHVMRALWGRSTPRGPTTYIGKHYALQSAQVGPLPAHPVGIWLGALKPRMVRLTGRLADGWSVSHNWLPPAEIPALRALIDAEAAAAGRSPQAIRRSYNVMGVIQDGAGPAVRARPGMIVEDVAGWASLLARFSLELGFDSFVYWPVAGDTRAQMRLWAEGVAPATRAQLAAAGRA